MKALPLIGLAHGSRHVHTPGAIESLMRATSRELDGTHAAPAYLDLTKPDLLQACRELGAAGHTEAVVVPLLFTEAFHARVDTPQALAAATAQTGVQLHRAGLIGMLDDVADAVLLRAGSAGIADDVPLSLYAVGSSSQRANDGVRELCDRVGRRRSGPVSASFATSADPRGVNLKPTGPLGIVPLFFAPGLLLDTLVRKFDANHEVIIAPPLGDLMASIVASRYREAVRLIVEK